MVLREETNSKLQKILDIDNMLDVQWWLYKSILSRQPMNSKYYKDWFKLYKTFYEIIEKLDNDSISDFEAAAEINKFLPKLMESKRALYEVLDYELKSSLDSVITKLVDGINSIKDILEGKIDERI